MLPGIRFLFAAVIFAFSLVIFGMGAAALLRSAHEEFASLPTRRMAPPLIVAQQPVEAPPTLSMLRVDTPAPEPVAAAPAVVAPVVQETAALAPVAADAEKAVPPEPTALPAAPAVPPIAEAAAPSDEAKPEVAKPEVAKVDTPDPVTTVAVAPSTPATLPPAVPDVAAATPAAPPAIETPDMPTATLTDDDALLSSSKVAMLDQPPADLGRVPLPVAKPVAKPVVKLVKKVAKKPVVKKRRVAAARPVAAAVQAQPTDPFGQPFGR